MALEITYFGPEQAANGTVSSGGSGEGFTYHCVSQRSVSGSKTAFVLGLQFLAGTLATYLLILLLSVRSSLRKNRVAGQVAVQA